jgi:hypothetical protein
MASKMTDSIYQTDPQKTVEVSASTTAKQRKESSTTGSFPVAQFDSSQKLCVVFGNVPKGIIPAPPAISALAPLDPGK